MGRKEAPPEEEETFLLRPYVLASPMCPECYVYKARRTRKELNIGKRKVELRERGEKKNLARQDNVTSQVYYYYYYCGHS